MCELLKFHITCTISAVKIIAKNLFVYVCVHLSFFLHSVGTVYAHIVREIRILEIRPH